MSDYSPKNQQNLIVLNVSKSRADAVDIMSKLDKGKSSKSVFESRYCSVPGIMLKFKRVNKSSSSRKFEDKSAPSFTPVLQSITKSSVMDKSGYRLRRQEDRDSALYVNSGIDKPMLQGLTGMTRLSTDPNNVGFNMSTTQNDRRAISSTQSIPIGGSNPPDGTRGNSQVSRSGLKQLKDKWYKLTHMSLKNNQVSTIYKLALKQFNYLDLLDLLDDCNVEAFASKLLNMTSKLISDLDDILISSDLRGSWTRDHRVDLVPSRIDPIETEIHHQVVRPQMPYIDLDYFGSQRQERDEMSTIRKEKAQSQVNLNASQDQLLRVLADEMDSLVLPSKRRASTNHAQEKKDSNKESNKESNKDITSSNQKPTSDIKKLLESSLAASPQPKHQKGIQVGPSEAQQTNQAYFIGPSHQRVGSNRLPVAVDQLFAEKEIDLEHQLQESDSLNTFGKRIDSPDRMIYGSARFAQFDQAEPRMNIQYYDGGQKHATPSSVRGISSTRKFSDNHLISHGKSNMSLTGAGQRPPPYRAQTFGIDEIQADDREGDPRHRSSHHPSPGSRGTSGHQSRQSNTINQSGFAKPASSGPLIGSRTRKDQADQLQQQEVVNNIPSPGQSQIKVFPVPPKTIANVLSQHGFITDMSGQYANPVAARKSSAPQPTAWIRQSSPTSNFDYNKDLKDFLNDFKQTRSMLKLQQQESQGGKGNSGSSRPLYQLQ